MSVGKPLSSVLLCALILGAISARDLIFQGLLVGLKVRW